MLDRSFLGKDVVKVATRRPLVKQKTAKNGRLTDKQAAFVQEYIVCLNATEAALRAGYKPKNAKSLGYQVLQKPHVQTAIQRAMDKRARRTEIEADAVLQELAKIAFLDIRQAFDEKGRLKDIQEIPEDVARSIAGIEQFIEFGGRGEDREAFGITKKIKLIEKTKALELLGRHLKLFKEIHEHSGKNGAPIPVEVTHKYANLSDDELRQLLANKLGRLAANRNAGPSGDH